MGSDKHYPEEAPPHRVAVHGFWIDRTPVTNREFRRFVNETGYVTFAEIASALGISQNTAASRYRYALTALKKSLPSV